MFVFLTGVSADAERNDTWKFALKLAHNALDEKIAEINTSKTLLR
jgi:hypothetical protein